MTKVYIIRDCIDGDIVWITTKLTDKARKLLDSAIDIDALSLEEDELLDNDEEIIDQLESAPWTEEDEEE